MIIAEFNNISHKRGSIHGSSPRPPTAGSQFFIVKGLYTLTDSKIIKGMEVADKVVLNLGMRITTLSIRWR